MYDEAAALAGQAAERRALKEAEQVADTPDAPARPTAPAGTRQALHYKEDENGASLQGEVAIHYRTPEEISKILGRPWPPAPEPTPDT